MAVVISPSMLACDFLNLEDEIEKLNKIKGIWLHLDVMDGHFVPNLTFGHEIIHSISQKSSNPSDVHLMVNNPEFYIDSLKEMGIHNITWHIENNCNHLDLIQKAKENFKSVGISIKPATPVSNIPDEILSQVNLVLVMSVEPGFGGQSFMSSALGKLEELRKIKKEKNYKFIIQIDGGISDKNAKDVIKHGAENLVAGSYIFKGSEAYAKKVEKLSS